MCSVKLLYLGQEDEEPAAEPEKKWRLARGENGPKAVFARADGCPAWKGGDLSKLGSPAYQVTSALNQVFAPGEPRHQDKKRGLAEARIYSFGTIRAYVEDCTRFAKWARERYGAKDIRALTPEMARTYIDGLAANERSGGYLGRIKSAIGKLSVVLHGERWDLGPGWHSDQHPERAYSPDDARRIVADLRGHARDPQVADVAELQRIGGLRRREAVQLRAGDIDPARCTLHLVRGTKGGRVREVRVDPKHGNYLKALKQRAERKGDGHIFRGRGSLGRRTERALDEACRRLGIDDHGTHGFRRTFAQERYREYRSEGSTDKEARKRLTQDLGHGRIAVTYSYVGRDWDN